MVSELSGRPSVRSVSQRNEVDDSCGNFGRLVGGGGVGARAVHEAEEQQGEVQRRQHRGGLRGQVGGQRSRL